MSVDIGYITQDMIAGWRKAVELVAAERVFLGRVTFPPFDPEQAFPLRHIENKWPMYCALADNEVVGWCDITPVDIPECAHRGILGMGVIAPFRHSGIGRRLLQACLEHCHHATIEKVELTVFTNNASAIALYRQLGFTEIGISRDYRRLDGVVYDALLMSLDLD